MPWSRFPYIAFFSNIGLPIFCVYIYDLKMKESMEINLSSLIP